MSEVVEEKIKDVHLAEELSKRYLSYAMSTIVARSLPDVRDGLKPVHRRLLPAMRQLLTATPLAILSKILPVRP